MAEKVKFGIIGIGNMGTGHAEMMENIKNVIPVIGITPPKRFIA